MIAPLVLLAALGVTLAAMQWRPWFALGLTLAVPLFFRFSSDGIAFGESVFTPQAGVTLPLSVVGAALFAGLIRAVQVRHADAAVLAFVAWGLMVFVIGLAVRTPAPLILLQVLGPGYFYVVGRSIERVADVKLLFIGLGTGAAAACLWLALSSVLLDAASGSDAISDRLIGGLVVYQAYDYFPFLLVIASMILLSLFLSTKQLRYVALALFTASLVLLLRSRVALLSLLIAGVVLLVLERQRVSLRTSAAIAGACIVCLGVAFIGGIPSVTRLVQGVTNAQASVDESNRTRLESMRTAGRLVLSSPLIGRAFEPTGRDVGTGLRKSWNAHNQYLDLAVRGGLPLAFAFAAVVIAAVAPSVRRERMRWSSTALDPYRHGLIAITFAAAVASNMAQSTFIQPLTANAMWLFLGVLVGLPQIDPHTAPSSVAGGRARVRTRRDASAEKESR